MEENNKKKKRRTCLFWEQMDCVCGLNHKSVEDPKIHEERRDLM